MGRTKIRRKDRIVLTAIRARKTLMKKRQKRI